MMTQVRSLAKVVVEALKQNADRVVKHAEVVRMVAGVVPVIAFYQLVSGFSIMPGGILRVRGDQVRT